MLGLVKVDQVRDELLCIRIVLSECLRIDFYRRLCLTLLFCWSLSFGVFGLCCGGCSLFLFLALSFLFLFLEALLLFLVKFLLFLFFLALFLDQLSVVLDALKVRAEPVLDTDLDLRAFESTHDFLVAKDISISERIFNVSKQGVVLCHLDEVVSQHRLVKQVLGALDVVPIVLLDIAGLAVSIDTNKQVLAVLCIDTRRCNRILQQLKAIIHGVKSIEVGSRDIGLEA